MQHLVGRALIAGLCVAAFVAIFALIGSGEFDETHARVIGTALGFSIFSAFAGAGDALRSRTSGWQEAVGVATVAVSLVAFALLLIPVWGAEDEEGAWQVWGIAAVLSICGSHASLVLRGLRPDDTPRTVALVWGSLITGLIVTAFAVLAIAELFDDVDESWGRAIAVILVLLLLSTALPPLIRRFGEAPPRAAGPERAGGAASLRGAGAPRTSEAAALADEILS
ncbi:MAG TPA: hypothetical protein VGW10_19665, partial [Solirubrobacteraceae bacterium]|nr:hypothetical protein [Solirubrobacteraceae bacterium]